MLTGKSRKPTCRPTVRNDHWLGSSTEPSACRPGKCDLAREWSRGSGCRQAVLAKRPSTAIVNSNFGIDGLVCASHCCDGKDPKRVGVAQIANLGYCQLLAQLGSLQVAFLFLTSRLDERHHPG